MAGCSSPRRTLGFLKLWAYNSSIKICNAANGSELEGKFIYKIGVQTLECKWEKAFPPTLSPSWPDRNKF